MALRGLDQLTAKLRRMPMAVQIAVRMEMEKSARDIVAMMKSLAPVLKSPDDRRRAGALRDSIDWTWGSAPKGSVSMGTVQGEGMVITIFAGTRDKGRGASDAFYARWVEFGTQKMAAQPYFFPAVRANKRGFTARINRAAVKEMKKVWG